MTTRELFFSLLKTALFNCPPSPDMPKSLTDEELTALYNGAKTQSMVPLVAYALSEQNLLSESEISAKFKKQMMHEALRSEKLIYETETVCGILENAGIEHVPLKGAVIRRLYPEPWMRGSCDIDVLVHESDLDKASAVLGDTLGYSTVKVTSHHTNMTAKAHTMLELHKDVLVNVANADEVLRDVWKNTVPHADSRYTRIMSNEFLIFHITAHMAKHFVTGGCGIKPFTDLYILKKKLNSDKEILDSSLKTAGLSEFYSGVLTLCDVWFGDGSHTDVTKSMENFILRGGVYGTLANHISANTRSESKSKLILNRIFMSPADLKRRYPILLEKPYLMPAMQVARWLAVLSPKSFKNAKNEAALIASASDKRTEEVRKMFGWLGLN